MICLSCNVNNVCRVYQDTVLRHQKEIDIRVHDCRLYTRSITESEQQPAGRPEPLPLPALNRDSIAEKIRAVYTEKEEVAPEEEPEKAFVCNCGSTSTGVARNCDKCDKVICEECLTKDASTNSYYCEDCW